LSTRSVRTSFAMLACSAALVACGGSGAKKPPPPSTIDLSFSGDLATPTIFDIAGKLGCNGYVDCQNTCASTNADPSAAASCIAMTCTPDVSPGGDARYTAALGCGQSYCLAGNDAGSARCETAGGMLVNLDGTMPSSSDPTNGSNPMKACYACLEDALASLYKRACIVPESADCNPVVCADDTQLCLDDKP
jgi:hypothetical protein